MKRVLPDNQSLFKRNRPTKENTIPKFIKMIPSFLSRDEIKDVKDCIDLLKKLKFLIPYLSQTDYFISTWAFAHESVELLSELFKAPEDRHQFLMLSHDNYHVIKEFMRKATILSFEEFQEQRETKQAILNLILQTKTHIMQPVIQEAMNAASLNEQLDKKTLSALQTMINEMTATLGGTIEAENAAHQIQMAKFQ